MKKGKEMKGPGISNTSMDSKHLCQPVQVVIDQRDKEVLPDTSLGKDRSLCSSLVEILIQRHQHSLSAYAGRLLGTDETAQDIIQDTWMALYLQVQQQPTSWVAQANIPAWLRAVVKNKAINYNKAQRRISSFDSEGAAFICEPRVPSFDYPENTAVREDVCRALYQAVNTLHKPQRDVIAYRFFYDCSLPEIGQTLGVPLNTVKARLSRGKKQLQKLLVESGVDCSDLDMWTLERSPKILLEE